MILAPGSTDVTTYFKLIDPAAGTPETGLVIANLDATYVRDRAAAVKNDLTALPAVNAAHADNQAIEVDAVNAPGLYRVDWPDAAFAVGVARVQLVVNGAAIDPAVIEVELMPTWAVPGDEMTLEDDAITSAKFDEATAFPLAAADAGVTQVARVGADGDTLETLSDQIDGVCTLGAGAVEVTYTLRSAVGPFDPVPDADVWVTTDIAGLNVIASGRTDAAGEVVFWLDSGTTVYVWRQKTGWNFVNPDTEDVP